MKWNQYNKLFFIEKITNNVIKLGIKEKNHIIKVLRMKVGDKVCLTDGLGSIWKAEISLIIKEKIELIILEHKKNYKKQAYYIHIGIAPTKSINRFEWFLEKSVEIGVNEITPLFCKHSERKNININRSIKIIRSAVKQSFKAYLPILNNPILYENFILSHINFGCKIITHCNKNFKRQYLKNFIKSDKKNYTILIGPEGDFSLEEIEIALSLGWEGVKLSRNRLRTETAALVALHTIGLYFEN